MGITFVLPLFFVTPPVSQTCNTGFPMEVVAAEITAVIRTCASLEVTGGSSEGLEAAFAVH